MPRTLVASLALIAAFASAAGAREYRFFEGSDRVYHQRRDHTLERIVEPHFYLERAQRSFANGHRLAAAENLERAASGFGYFGDRAAGEQRRQLELARRALRALAGDVRRGAVDESTTLERALSDARRVLAGEAAMTDPREAAPAASS